MLKNVETDIQLKERARLKQRKRTPIPFHLQPAVEKEIEKLKTKDSLEKLKFLIKPAS